MQLLALLASHTLDDTRALKLFDLAAPDISRVLFSSALSEISPAAQQTILHSPNFTATLAHEWLSALSEAPSSYLKKEIAEVENGYWALALLADSSLYTLDEALDRLERLHQSYSGNGATLAKLLDHRPELLRPALTIERKNILTAVAGSRHLFDGDLFDLILQQALARKLDKTELEVLYLTLIANPNSPQLVRVESMGRVNAMRLPAATFTAPEDSYRPNGRAYNQLRDEIDRGHSPDPISIQWELTTGDDLERIKHAVFKLLPSNNYPTFISSFTALQQSQSQSPTSSEPSTDLSFLGIRELASLTSQDSLLTFFNSKVNAALDPYGASAWEIFLVMAPTWQSSLIDLTEVAISIAKR